MRVGVELMMTNISAAKSSLRPANIMQGSADITEAQWAELKAGKYYVNVHTAKFPDGEVRGQLLTK